MLTKVRIAERLGDLLAEFAARSNSATRASMSSISRAWPPRSRTTSAARKRVPAGAFVSNMIFNRVVTAAPAPSCSRASDCQNAVRRASRYAASNSGSLVQRRSVLALIRIARAASSTFLCESSAAIACSFLWSNFAPCPNICHHLPLSGGEFASTADPSAMWIPIGISLQFG